MIERGVRELNFGAFPMTSHAAAGPDRWKASGRCVTTALRADDERRYNR
jgi:hypothetical protein